MKEGSLLLDRVSVLIPYQTDHNGPRDSAFEWVLGFYERVMPEVEVCVGEIKDSGELFSRSKAVNRAYLQATKDIIVIADSDIVYDPNLLKKSITYVNDGQWVIPFSRILRLSKETSQLLLKRPSEWPLLIETDAAAEQATAFVGGFNVLGRNAYEAVGGYDERFVGWGGEDEAFAYALDTLIGRHLRMDGEMVHFWHPFVGPDGNPNYDSNYALYQRYQMARGNQEEMRQLIQKPSSHEGGANSL